MNKEWCADLEAFEKWYEEKMPFIPIEDLALEGWMSACEYKNQEYSWFVVEAKSHAQTQVNLKIKQTEIEELEKEKDYLCKKMENMREIYKNSEHLQNENKKLKQLLEKATAVIKRCEFGLQPEFYGGEDNGSLKDCRDFLKELEQK